jgi:hypothetical protein
MASFRRHLEYRYFKADFPGMSRISHRHHDSTSPHILGSGELRNCHSVDARLRGRGEC